MQQHKNIGRDALFASLLFIGLCLTACNHSTTSTSTSSSVDYTQVVIPDFNADSAYQFVADQLEFGYRTPGSKGWQQCAAYLVSQMQRWCDTVIVQDFSTTLWNGQQVKGKNIIASIEPEQPATQRILLAAHWDSRQWADHDPNPDNHKKPIMGANDGASGVGALMEMARVITMQRPQVAIDFIFFDVEDQGIADWADIYEDNTWCLGSQYWGQHPHTPYYTAAYGILFDMVGTKQPRFTKEAISMHYAQNIMNKMWNAAAALGHASVFVDSKSSEILDDHLYVNQLRGIPTIDVVQNTPNCSFYEYWHTVNDNIDAISKETLKLVADVTLTTIYADYGE